MKVLWRVSFSVSLTRTCVDNLAELEAVLIQDDIIEPTRFTNPSRSRDSDEEGEQPHRSKPGSSASAPKSKFRQGNANDSDSDFDL